MRSVSYNTCRSQRAGLLSYTARVARSRTGEIEGKAPTHKCVECDFLL